MALHQKNLQASYDEVNRYHEEGPGCKSYLQYHFGAVTKCSCSQKLEAPRLLALENVL